MMLHLCVEEYFISACFDPFLPTGLNKRRSCGCSEEDHICEDRTTDASERVGRVNQDATSSFKAAFSLASKGDLCKHSLKYALAY